VGTQLAVTLSELSCSGSAPSRVSTAELNAEASMLLNEVCVSRNISNFGTDMTGATTLRSLLLVQMRTRRPASGRSMGCRTSRLKMLKRAVVGADANGDGQDGHHGEAGGLEEGAEGELEVGMGGGEREVKVRVNRTVDCELVVISDSSSGHFHSHIHYSLRRAISGSTRAGPERGNQGGHQAGDRDQAGGSGQQRRHPAAKRRRAPRRAGVSQKSQARVRDESRADPQRALTHDHLHHLPARGADGKADAETPGAPGRANASTP